MDSISRVLQEGMRLGFFRALDPVKVAAMLFEADMGMIAQRLSSERPGPVEQDAEFLFDMFTRGISMGATKAPKPQGDAARKGTTSPPPGRRRPASAEVAPPPYSATKGPNPMKPNLVRSLAAAGGLSPMVLLVLSGCIHNPPRVYGGPSVSPAPEIPWTPPRGPRRKRPPARPPWLFRRASWSGRLPHSGRSGGPGSQKQPPDRWGMGASPVRGAAYGSKRGDYYPKLNAGGNVTRLEATAISGTGARHLLSAQLWPPRPT